MNLSFPSPQQYDVRALNIKQQIFDHFIFPYKLNPNILSQFNGNHITLDQFKELASKQLSQQDAEILFLFYGVAMEQEPVLDKRIAEIKSLRLFLNLQTFNQAARHSIFDIINISDPKYQERSQKQAMNNFSPLNSPRAKTMRIQTQQNEVLQILQFVKGNFKEFLKAVSTSDEFINPNEFNLLNLIIQGESKNISQQLFDKPVKQSTESIAESATKLLQCPESAQLISGFIKSVTVKQNVSGDLKIQQCEDSMIYIESAVNSLAITQCTNCQIFVSSVRLVTSIASCEKVAICVASNLLKISNTIDSQIHYFGSYAPVIYGDCRNIVLAPHSGNVMKIFDRLRDAKIPISKANRDRFLKPIVMGSSKIDWSLQSIDDFARFIVPEDQFGSVDSSLIIDCNFDIDRMAKEINDKRILSQPITQDRIVLPLLAPSEYIKQLFDRYKLFANLQAQIKQANLKEDYSKGLQNAIQGNFREWLITAGAIKGISELVRLIDQDQ